MFQVFILSCQQQHWKVNPEILLNGIELSYVCQQITDKEGDFLIILYFISLISLSISMVCAYRRRHTYEGTNMEIIIITLPLK